MTLCIPIIVKEKNGWKTLIKKFLNKTTYCCMLTILYRLGVKFSIIIMFKKTYMHIFANSVELTMENSHLMEETG